MLRGETLHNSLRKYTVRGERDSVLWNLACELLSEFRVAMHLLRECGVRHVISMLTAAAEAFEARQAAAGRRSPHVLHGTQC